MVGPVGIFSLPWTTMAALERWERSFIARPVVKYADRFISYPGVNKKITEKSYNYIVEVFSNRVKQSSTINQQPGTDVAF
jgi:hypothetical protein